MKHIVFNTERNYIKNTKLKTAAISLNNQLPGYFFEVPASSTGKYHPKFTEGEGGLVRHTKVAATIGNTLLTNNSVGNVFTDNEKDLMIIALLVHDGFKSGIVKEKYTKHEHPVLMAKFIMDNYAKLGFAEQEAKLIANSVASHMGEWNKKAYSDIELPTPKNKYQKMVHMCDYLASRKFIETPFDGNEIIF